MVPWVYMLKTFISEILLGVWLASTVLIMDRFFFL